MEAGAPAEAAQAEDFSFKKMKRESVRQLKAEIKHLRALAYVDELTGILNRHGFKEEAKRFLGEVVRGGGAEKRKNVLINDFSLILFDADYFKKVNDTYGHPAGDIVLKVLAETIADRVREIDIVARWGGEEILTGMVGASEKDAAEVAEDIRARIENLVVKYKNKKIKFTVSAGVASLGKSGDFEEVLSHVDEALYKAKSAGRNKVMKYSDLYL